MEDKIEKTAEQQNGNPGQEVESPHFLVKMGKVLTVGDIFGREVFWGVTCLGFLVCGLELPWVRGL